MQRKMTLKHILFIAGALALVVLIVLMASFLRNRLFRSSAITQVPGIELSADYDLYAYAGGGFVAVRGNELLFLDANGKVKNSGEIPTGPDVIIAPAGKSVAVYTDEKLKVFYSGETEPYPKDLNIAMADVVCSTVQDYVALLESDRNMIYLLNNIGTNFDKISFPDQTVAGMGWFPENELLWVVSLDVNGSTPSSVVRIYEPGKTQVALSEFNDEIIYHLVVDKANGSAQMIGTQNITSMVISTGETKNVALVYGYQYVGASDSGSTILLAPAAEIANGHITSLRIVSGGKAVNVQLPAGCKVFCVGEKNIYAADSASIYTVGLDGVIKSTTTFDVLYDSVKPIGNSSMMFFSDGAATLVKLPD